MKKVFTRTCLTLIIAVSTSTHVLADPLSDQLQTQQNQLRQQQDSLSQSQQKTHDLEEKIQMLDDQIQNLMIQIDLNNEKIKATKASLADAELQVKNAEDDLKKQQILFADRVRTMYENNGSMGHLKMLLNSKGIIDFFNKIDAIKRIGRINADIKKQLEAKKQVLNDTKNVLKNKNDELVALQSNIQKDLENLNSNKANISTLVAQAREEERQYSTEVNASQTLVAATMKKIQQIRASAPSSRSNNSAPLSDNNLIAYASNFLGTPYLWGGTTPSGFDCSGFVQYVYRHFGVNLPRTTYDQINVGVTVSRDELQPGDLIFAGSLSAPHHVGMYVGDGMYIHAPHTGDVVKISPVYNFTIAKRVR